MTSGALKGIEREFELSGDDLKAMIRNFHLEMDRALFGKRSSLKMIPTFIDRPSGSEKGRYIALDLGGTNFRVMSVTLEGCGRLTHTRVMKFTLGKEEVASTGKRLFKFLALSVKRFMREEKISRSERIYLGFTFSFPVRQAGVASGTLVSWTKGFSASGVEGRDVVSLLTRALKGEGLGNISVAALANDTVGTLVAGSYCDKECDVGVIIGTGTNACYVEKIRRIKKFKGRHGRSRNMIVNIEWGNFDKLKATPYDRRLDSDSDNPGAQALEKMVSGMYIGEICRLVIRELICKELLLAGRTPKKFNDKASLSAEFVSGVLKDSTRSLAGVRTLLGRAGAKVVTDRDAKVVRRICEIVSVRAARICAAAIIAVVTRMDPGIKKYHTIAVDGSIYEKLHNFSGNIKTAIEELSGDKSVMINTRLTRDGSGKGAAIIAAIAAG